MLDLLYKRRSIRKYKSDKIEEEKIGKIVEAALLSPSGRNRRPWEFVFVTNEKSIKDLAHSKETGIQFVETAPLVIVVLGDENLAETWVEDTSIALTFIQLEAEALGLGSCWVQLRDRKTKDGERSETYVKRVLGIENELRVEAIVSIGYPDEIKEPYTKDGLDYSKIKIIK